MDLLTSRDKLTGPKYNACVMTQYGQKLTNGSPPLSLTTVAPASAKLKRSSCISSCHKSTIKKSILSTSISQNNSTPSKQRSHLQRRLRSWHINIKYLFQQQPVKDSVQWWVGEVAEQWRLEQIFAGSSKRLSVFLKWKRIMIIVLNEI